MRCATGGQRCSGPHLPFLWESYLDITMAILFGIDLEMDHTEAHKEIRVDSDNLW